MRIPVCEPTLTGKEWKYVEECLRTNWISSRGRFIGDFEEGFAKYVGVSHGISTTSGTTALHLAMATLGLRKGDEVIVPAFTMIASVLPLIYVGAKPVLVDAEPETWNLDTGQVESRVTERTKAIMPVHIYGHPCEMGSLMEIAKDHAVSVVEDAAEAHGAEYRGKKAGSFGDLACFSFYANKIITTGEGGMLLTDVDKLGERARLLKDLAFTKERRFLHYEIGYNYRMTNLQAAVGVSQLSQIDGFVAARRRNAKEYNRRLQPVRGVTLPPSKDWAKNVYWMYSIQIEEEAYGLSRDELIRRLARRGIETRPFFLPMHQQPVLQEMGLFQGETYPVAETLAETGLNLPSSSSLSKEQIASVCEAIQEEAR